MEFTFQKERRTFGRPISFEDKDEIIFSENSNRDFIKDYILRNPIHRATQYTNQMALSEANTERATYKHIGLTHNEGGWPKDISMSDPEQTVR